MDPVIDMDAAVTSTWEEFRELFEASLRAKLEAIRAAFDDPDRVTLRGDYMISGRVVVAQAAGLPRAILVRGAASSEMPPALAAAAEIQAYARKFHAENAEPMVIKKYPVQWSGAPPWVEVNLPWDCDTGPNGEFIEGVTADRDLRRAILTPGVEVIVRDREGVEEAYLIGDLGPRNGCEGCSTDFPGATILRYRQLVQLDD